MKKSIIYIVALVLTYLIYEFISGYHSVNQNKYGIEYNDERKQLGISEIPDSFVLTEKPINDLFDYFQANGLYTLQYTSKIRLDSGLVKKRIDVDETGIGIIREYSYYKKGNDTLVDIHNYYNN